MPKKIRTTCLQFQLDFLSLKYSREVGRICPIKVKMSRLAHWREKFIDLCRSNTSPPSVTDSCEDVQMKPSSLPSRLRRFNKLNDLSGLLNLSFTYTYIKLGPNVWEQQWKCLGFASFLFYWMWNIAHNNKFMLFPKDKNKQNNQCEIFVYIKNHNVYLVYTSWKSWICKSGKKPMP